jgi:phosphoribosylanthranilate isomerase
LAIPTVRIKICGITHAEDARLAAELGAHALGFNFYESTPRFLDPERARGIVRDLPPFIEPVALFVDKIWPEVQPVLAALERIRTVQWYGAIPDIGQVRPYSLVPAFSISEREHLQEITRYLDGCRCQGQLPAAILVDAHVPGLLGGTGRTAPWHILAEFHPGVPLILAGGLTPENVAEAIRIVRPYAVDVAGGVESSPGRKDPEKLRRFIANARAAAER